MQPVMSGSAVGQNLLASGSTKQSVVQSGKAVKAAAENVGSKVSGFNQFVGGILDTLGHLLPGSAGQSLLAVSYRLRGAQAAVDRTKRVSAQAQGMVLGRQGTSPFASVLDDDSGTTNAANPMLGSASQTTAEATGSSRPQTAFVDPGKQLQLSLVARPVGRLASEHVSFKLYSKSLEVQDTEPIVQDGVAIFKGMTGIMFYLPQIVVGVAALILVIILLAVTRVLG